MDTNYFIHENKGLDIITDLLNVAIGLFVLFFLIKLIINAFSYMYRVSIGVCSDLFAGLLPNKSGKNISNGRTNRKTLFKDDLSNTNDYKKDNIDLDIEAKKPIFKKGD